MNGVSFGRLVNGSPLNFDWGGPGSFDDPRLNLVTGNRPATVPTHEYTLGGPIRKDRLWFFTAGRLQDQKEGRQLTGTQIPYELTRDTQRYEFKGTYSATSAHRTCTPSSSPSVPAPKSTPLPNPATPTPSSSTMASSCSASTSP